MPVVSSLANLPKDGEFYSNNCVDGHCIGCRRSCRRWKAYQLTLKIIKVRAKKHCYLDPMPDSRTNEVKNRTKKYKGFSQ